MWLIEVEIIEQSRKENYCGNWALKASAGVFAEPKLRKATIT